MHFSHLFFIVSKRWQNIDPNNRSSASRLNKLLHCPQTPTHTQTHTSTVSFASCSSHRLSPSQVLVQREEVTWTSEHTHTIHFSPLFCSYPTRPPPLLRSFLSLALSVTHKVQLWVICHWPCSLNFMANIQHTSTFVFIISLGFCIM